MPTLTKLCFGSTQVKGFPKASLDPVNRRSQVYELNLLFKIEQRRYTTIPRQNVSVYSPKYFPKEMMWSVSNLKNTQTTHSTTSSLMLSSLYWKSYTNVGLNCMDQSGSHWEYCNTVHNKLHVISIRTISAGKGLQGS